MCGRIERGRTSIKQTTSTPVLQDRKTSATAEVACRGRRCRTQRTGRDSVSIARSPESIASSRLSRLTLSKRQFPSNALPCKPTEDPEADRFL